MTPTKHTNIELTLDPEAAHYVAALERKVLVLTLDNLKCRTMLELLTDESWDDEIFPKDEEGLKKVAADAMVRRLGITPSEARNIVNDRWETHNPPPADDSTKSYLIGPDPNAPTRTKRVIPNATVPGVDMEKHRAGLAKLAQSRLGQTKLTQQATQQP